MDSSPKRRRIASPPPSLMIEEEEYTPYVSVKVRRAQQLTKLESKHSSTSTSSILAERKRKQQQEEDDDELLQQQSSESFNKREGPKGNTGTLLIEAQEVKRLKALQGISTNVVP